MKSIYERGNPRKDGLSSGWALARITAVDSDNRLLEIKTFFASTPELEDLTIPKVQWLNTDGNAEGDESGSIPRLNSYGLVFSVAGEMFMWGMQIPTNTDQKPAGDIQETVNTGDKVLKTIGENKIILRSHGEIDIQATNSCRTFYIPDQHIIDTLCRNYTFHCDGGSVDWENTDEETLYQAEYRSDIARTAVIQEFKGAVDSTTVYQWQSGIGIPGGLPGANMLTQVQMTVDREGVVNIDSQPPLPEVPDVPLGFHAEINPTGAFKIQTGPEQFSLEVEATGEVTLTVNSGLCEINIAPTGKTTISVGEGLAEVTISPTGKVSIDALSGVDITTEGELNIEALAGITAKALGPMTLSGATIKLDGLGAGGAGAIGKLLVFPLALSDFTGLPIMVGSSTLSGSI